MIALLFSFFDGALRYSRMHVLTLCQHHPENLVFLRELLSVIIIQSACQEAILRLLLLSSSRLAKDSCCSLTTCWHIDDPWDPTHIGCLLLFLRFGIPCGILFVLAQVVCHPSFNRDSFSSLTSNVLRASEVCDLRFVVDSGL